MKTISVTRYCGHKTEFVINPKVQPIIERLTFEARGGLVTSKKKLKEIERAFATLELLACFGAGIKIRDLFVKERLYP